MEIINQLIDFILHLDFHLYHDYGLRKLDLPHPVFNCICRNWFGIAMPLLPGDSLLFAAGTFCAGVVQNGQTAS